MFELKTNQLNNFINTFIWTNFRKVRTTLNRWSQPYPMQINNVAWIRQCSITVLLSKASPRSHRHPPTHTHHHICLLSDLTGSKFCGNRSALVSFPHSAHRHLVPWARTENLRNEVNRHLSVWALCMICFALFCFISRHRRQADSEIRSFYKHEKT